MADAAPSANADKRYTGTVKTFKGAFGFIECKDYGVDIFVHKKFSFGENFGNCTLNVGEAVSFKIVLKPDAPNEGQAQAHEIATL